MDIIMVLTFFPHRAHFIWGSRRLRLINTTLAISIPALELTLRLLFLGGAVFVITNLAILVCIRIHLGWPLGRTVFSGGLCNGQQ